MIRIKQPKAWICSCRRKNAEEDAKCAFCGADKPTKRGLQQVAFSSNGSFSKVQRGDYECSKGPMYFRSKWEANWALYLDFMVKNGQYQSWEYENKTFVFEKVEFGIRRYLPDFEVTNADGTVEYHEIKGYMDSASKTKLKRMKKYYPEVKLILVDVKFYNVILKKLKGIIKFY